jgi:hypothetical protein
MNCNSVKNQRIKGEFVNREVIYCVSSLVHELAQDEKYDLFDMYRGAVDYDAMLYDNGVKVLESVEVGEFCIVDIEYKDNPSIDDESVDWFDDEQEAIESWCYENDIDAYDYETEIYEHWIVTEWLAAKLESKGEKITRDFFGMTIWGRGCTGQAILLDSVISGICSDLEILEGQRNEWKV